MKISSSIYGSDIKLLGVNSTKALAPYLALWTTLMDMMNDPRLTRVYLMIDALNECDLKIDFSNQFRVWQQ